MIKFLAELEGRPCLGIGLSDFNIEKLKQGHPIHLNAESLDLPELKVKDIIILWGVTEQAMYQELIGRGLIDKETVIKDDRNKPKM